MQYLHAGMVQHDPQGRPAFLHRTAEAKVYPFNTGYRKVGALFPMKNDPLRCRTMTGLYLAPPVALSVQQ